MQRCAGLPALSRMKRQSSTFQHFRLFGGCSFDSHTDLRWCQNEGWFQHLFTDFRFTLRITTISFHHYKSHLISIWSFSQIFAFAHQSIPFGLTYFYLSYFCVLDFVYFLSFSFDGTGFILSFVILFPRIKLICQSNEDR